MNDFIDEFTNSLNGKFTNQSPIMDNLYHKLQNDEKALKFNRITCEITGTYKLAIVTPNCIFTVLLDASRMKQVVEVSCEGSIIFPLNSESKFLNMDYTKTFFSAVEEIEKEIEQSKYDNIIKIIREAPYNVLLTPSSISYIDADTTIELSQEEVRALLFRALEINEC